MSKELEALERFNNNVVVVIYDELDGELYPKKIERINKDYDLLKQALKRNEPMKVDLKTKYALPYSGTYYKCPKCETLHIRMSYVCCPICRQELDWSDEK